MLGAVGLTVGDCCVSHRRGDPIEERDQHGFFERLGNVIVHPGSEAALAVTGHGVCSHGDDRSALSALRPLHGADAGSRFEAIHLRHLHIHEDDVECLGARECHCFATIRRMGKRVAAPGQNAGGERAVDHVVFREQDAQSGGRAAVARRGCFLAGRHIIRR